jgi:hypothetical protein
MRPSDREFGRPRTGVAELNRGASVVIGNLLDSGRALRARSAIVSGMSRWGAGGFPIQIGGGFLYNTYPDVSCMYPACILHVF